jgi:serpin B
MALSGARNKTAEQLKTLLNLNGLSNEQIFDLQSSYLKTLANLNDSVALNVANKLYSKQGFQLNKEFTDNLAKYYNTEAQLLDFSNAQESAKTINAWVANKTNDKIKDLMDAGLFNALTRLVLVNAIYFKGKWLHPFDKVNTYKEDFTLRDGSVKKVDMMKLINKKFIFKINPGGLTACTCELPYIGDSISMTVILPHEGINIEDVEKQLNHQALQDVFDKNARLGKVHLYLPKFKLDLKAEVNFRILLIFKSLFHLIEIFSFLNR